MRPVLSNFVNRWKIFAAVLGILFVIAARINAAPLRVVTWNLQPKAGGETGDPKSPHIQDAAAVLKTLDPDVIFVQHVAGWQSCDALIRALQPANYHLAVCSSFREPKSGALSKAQVAILSKSKAILSWSDTWKIESISTAAPVGFAFAAIRIDNKEIGCFSVAMSGNSDGVPHNRENSVRQLLVQVAVLRNWTANRVNAVVVAGDCGVGMEAAQSGGEQSLRLLNDAGLASVFVNIPPDQRLTFSGNAKSPAATRDYVFAKDAGLVATPKITRTDWSEHYPISCELDLNALGPNPAPAIAPIPAPVAHVEPAAKTPEPVISQTNSAATPAPVPVPAPPHSTTGAPTTSLTAAPVLGVQAAVPENPNDNMWLLACAISVGFLLILVIWRLTAQPQPQPTAPTLLTLKADSVASISLPSNAERVVITHQPAVSTGTAGRQPIVRIETADSSHTQSQMWQRRAEEAERRADRANELARAGFMPHLSRWLKDKLTRKLVSDRAALMETQRAATLKLLAVDDRLAKIESQLQQRDRDYERRIDDLTRELAVAKEENRELIRAKIALVRAEMEREKTRAAAQKPEDSTGL